MSHDDERSPNFEKRVPEGDNRLRLVCEDCGFIHYDNPRIVVGAVAEYEGSLLLGRRAIPPRLGFWNVPAGFLEIGESPEEGARREVLEETGAQIEILDLLGVYSVDRIGQVHLIYRASLDSPRLEAGPESQEVGLFRPDEIPFDELAFSTNVWALRHYEQSRGRRPLAPFTAPADPEGW